MRIIVCIKIVSGKYVKNVGRDVTINPYDLYALNQAKRIKEACGAEIICISMGVSNPLIEIEAMDYKCDKMIFISDEKFAGSDTVATSYTLAKAIRKIGEYDYIFCGDCSVDGETGQISYDLASELKLDHLGKISKVDYADDTLKLFRTQNDMEYCYGARRPMIISFEGYVIGKVFSLFQIKRLARIKPTVWSAEDIGVKNELIGERGSKTEIVGIKKISKGRQRSCTISKDLNEFVACVNMFI